MSVREKRAAAINANALTNAEIMQSRADGAEEEDDDSDYDPSKDDKETSKKERDDAAFTWATSTASNAAGSSSASATSHSVGGAGAREWRDDDPVFDEFDRKAKLERQLTGFTHKRARLAGEHWASMMDADREHVVAKRSKAMVPFTDTSFDIIMNINKKRKTDGLTSKKSQLHEMMSTIYGTTIGGNSVSSTNAILQSSSSSKIVTSEDVRNQIVDSVKNIQRKEKVMETRKFAGQQIQIERTLKVGETSDHGSSSSSSNRGHNASGSSSSSTKGGVDSVLDIMKGPKVVSTVAKSSLDWDNYKEEQGLEDGLAAAAKDGYLTRKEFLERVDYRKFEQERDERLKRMAAAQMAAGGAAGPTV